MPWQNAVRWHGEFSQQLAISAKRTSWQPASTIGTGESHFLKAQEVARRILADPSMIADAQRFVETRILLDPHQRAYAIMWRDLLNRPPAEIAAALTKDSAPGRLLRETRPVFGKGLTSREVAELIEHADAPPRHHGQG
jgi:hypothetical protein